MPFARPWTVSRLPRPTAACEPLVERLESHDLPPERLRALHALRILEDQATPESRRLLQELAAGERSDLLTGAAAAVLARLTSRTSTRP